MNHPEPSSPVAAPAAQPDAQSSYGVPRDTSVTSEISGPH